MADETERTVPTVGDPVHQVRRQVENQEKYGLCRGAMIIHIPRQEEGEDKGEMFPHIRVQIASTQVLDHNQLGTAINAQQSTMLVEHSSDGLSGTWHFPHECPYA